MDLRIESYDLDLDVDFSRAQLVGRVKITFESRRRDLVLDAVDLEIDDVRTDGSSLPYKLDKDSGTLTVLGVSGLSSVEVHYTKTVSDDVIFGLYKSRYGSEYMLVTDLEPAEARKVFPCKDDPSYKAVFNLEVVTEKGLSVISNSAVKSKNDTADGRVRHRFHPTPRMSTYLLFIGIGRFEEVKLSSQGLEVIAAARPKQAHKSKFILGIASAVLKDYSQYFGIAYPLEKLHLIALPEYHTGAMENWGAITSRESYVLVGERSGVSSRKRAALVITHEIAHQWFGDLVTMKWWNDLWLNESFATFMEHKMMSRARPEWDVWADFLRFETFRSMNQDALRNTHPIEVRVDTPDEIGQAFDAISYGKGANVIRMIESYIGEENFRKGVSDYLHKFSYSNARGKDLWKSLESSSGQPVSRIMGAWVRKPGYPLVKVMTSRGRVTLSQSRFSLENVPTRETWPIPVTFEVNGNHGGLLLEKKSTSIEIPKAARLVVNPMRTGYYSVLYDRSTYDRIAADFASLSQYDKGGLMNDLFLFLQAGKIGPELYYRFVSLCSKVSDPLVVQAVTDQLVFLNSIAGDARRIRECMMSFLTSQIHRLGILPAKGEDERRKDVREAVSSQLAMVDISFAKKLAKRFEDYDRVDPDTKAAVAVAYAIARGPAAFEPLLEMVKHQGDELERSRLYRAMTSFREPGLVNRTLELAISGEVSRSDTGYTLIDAAANPLARDVLWAWVDRRYERLWEIYGGSQQVFIFLDAVIPRCGLGHEPEVRRFLSDKIRKHGGVTFRRTLEQLEVNSRLRARLLRDT